MKRVLLVFVLVVLSSCKDRENKENILQDHATYPGMELRGSYVLMQLRSEDLSSEEIILEIDEDKKELSGSIGCNRFSVRYERDGNQINFDEPVGTKAFCAGKMETEEEIYEVVSEISKVQEEGNELIFLSEDNEPLLRVQKTEASE